MVAIGIFSAAITLPSLYWTVFRETSSIPNVVYSRVLDDFMMMKREDGVLVRVDTEGNRYTRDEFEQLLPILFFRQRLTSGDMPDTLHGVYMDHAELSKHAANFTIRPVDMNSPRPVLWPLLESQSGRVSLALPEDYFRLHDKIEFIDAASNRLDREKSALFQKALEEVGFSFPARLVSGLPTDRKSVDEGYFIKDKQGDIFHLKMVRGTPYVARIEIPADMNIVHIECVDLATEEFFAYLFTEDNRVFLLMQDDYRLQQLPVEGYDKSRHRLRIRTDLLHKTVSIIGEDHLKVIVVCGDYHVVDTLEISWPPAHERRDHILFSRVFPFQINLLSSDSRYVTLDVFQPKGYAFIFLHLALLGLSILLMRRKQLNLKRQVPDLLIILLTGIFGFIATQVFPNKFYE